MAQLIDQFGWQLADVHGGDPSIPHSDYSWKSQCEPRHRARLHGQNRELDGELFEEIADFSTLGGDPGNHLRRAGPA